jgi:hypothetical protein
MKSRLIASVLAAALALTAITASPAAALDQGERNRLVLGLGALAIIGALASHSQGSSGGYVGHNDNRWDDRYDRDGRYDRDRRYHSNRNWLPAGCQFAIKTRYGTQNVLGQSCLSQSDIRTSYLPSSCAFEIRTSRGQRTVYGARCLEQKGYRIEARR